jgi:hypothetical protein
MIVPKCPLSHHDHRDLGSALSRRWCANATLPDIEVSKIIEWPHFGRSPANVRVASVNAAKNLTPGSCTLFNTVRAAWNAISVPAQAGEPTC